MTRLAKSCIWLDMVDYRDQIRTLWMAIAPIRPLKLEHMLCGPIRDGMAHDVGVKQNHGMKTTVAGNTMRIIPTLVVILSDHKENATVTFVTNLSVSGATKKARRRTRRVIRRYARRWAIENSYKSIKDFLAWTTSQNTTVRVFYFGFAVIHRLAVYIDEFRDLEHLYAAIRSTSTVIISIYQQREIVINMSPII